MTVSELTVKDADALLRKMYYNVESYGEDLSPEEYEDYDEHWSELAYSLQSTSRYDLELMKMVPRDAGHNTVDGITIGCVADVGGGEGGGETRFVVFSFADDTGTKYFRKDGYYASYDGTTWDGDFREVTAQDRVVTFYE